jgi:hypothetical protein
MNIYYLWNPSQLTTIRYITTRRYNHSHSYITTNSHSHRFITTNSYNHSHKEGKVYISGRVRGKTKGTTMFLPTVE